MRILLVEDDGLFQQLFQDCIPTTIPVELQIVESLDEGLQKSNEFDLCIFDLILPDAESIESTINRIHTIVEKPCVVLSVLTDYELAYKLGKMKIGFISKKIDYEGLIMCVTNIIGFYEPDKSFCQKLQNI